MSYHNCRTTSPVKCGNRFRAVLFDLDGTLVHTAPEYKYKIVGLTLQELGIPIPANSHIDTFWFEHDRNSVIRQLFGTEPEVFWKIYLKYEEMNAELKGRLTSAYDDTIFIQNLRRTGIKTGIVSGAPIKSINMSIELLGKKNFNVVVRSQPSSGIKPKPDPHGILECLKQLSVQPKETVFVGNGPEDVQAAKAAGVYDVLIDRSEYNFPYANPSLKIKSLRELGKLFGL